MGSSGELGEHPLQCDLSVRRFKELGVSSEKDIPMLDPVELVSRKALPFDTE